MLGIFMFEVDSSHIAPYAIAAVLLAVVLGLLAKVKQ
jgi:hypothetical protein